MSTNLRRLESPDADPHVGGVLITFDSGIAKTIAWRVKPGELISPALDAAKEYTAAVLEQLLRGNHEAEVRETNWVSVTAAMHKIIRDFNGALHDLQRERDAATVQ